MRAEDSLVERVSISSLQEFVKLLEDLDANFLIPGLLVQIEGDCSVEQILEWHSSGKDLPDIVNSVFETVPGKTRYLLSCDTYHGGGVFERMHGHTEDQVNRSPRLLELVEQAIQAVDRDVEARRVLGGSWDDLLAMRKELLEVRSGQRDDFSPGLNHMILDSMSWDQPCLKEFRLVAGALFRAARSGGSMKPSNLKASVSAGLIKSYSEGMRTWSRKSIEGLVSPSGFTNNLDDVEIQRMLAELESEGLIKIIGGESNFLELLDPVGSVVSPSGPTSADLADHFERQLQELFGAPPNLARFLFGRWGIRDFTSHRQIDAFLASDLFRKAICPNGQINLLKRHAKAEIEAFGTSLHPEGGDGHEFVDSKFGYRWRQVYHGMGEVWLDLYSVTDPQVDEAKVQAAKKSASLDA
jgi:hypothetical protein